MEEKSNRKLNEHKRQLNVKEDLLPSYLSHDRILSHYLLLLDWKAGDMRMKVR